MTLFAVAVVVVVVVEITVGRTFLESLFLAVTIEEQSINGTIVIRSS